MSNIERELGEYGARLTNIENSLQSIEADVRFLRDTENKRRGAVKVFAASAAAIGSLISFIAGRVFP